MGLESLSGTRRVRARVAGSLLAEAILGTILVAVALGLLASSITSWERLVKSSRDRNGARIVARQEMERCLGLGFEDLDTCDTAGVPILLDVVRSLDGAETVSSYETEITVALRPDKRVKSVDITTRYGDQKSLHLQLYTLVYQSS